MDPPAGKLSREKIESKKPFIDCATKPDLGFSRKRAFSTDKPDAVRNGLRSREFVFELWLFVLDLKVSFSGFAVGFGHPEMAIFAFAQVRSGVMILVL